QGVSFGYSPALPRPSGMPPAPPQAASASTDSNTPRLPISGAEISRGVRRGGAEGGSAPLLARNASGSDMNRAIAAGQGGLANRFRGGRMRMAGQRQILGRGAEFHCHADLVDHLARIGADDVV